jgi:hypothetical protein
MDLAEKTFFQVSASKILLHLSAYKTGWVLGESHWENLSVGFQEFSSIVISIIIINNLS